MTGVSFFVPTLNRNPMVLRTVRSCLAALETAGVAGEVIVLDSESDDGSWEALNAEFGKDSRVRLRQNRRGLGPTRSWCDNVAGFEGEYATFIWSDDYVAPHFLTTLLPPLEAGAALAIGTGAIRPMDCEEPLSRDGGRIKVSRGAAASGYLRKGRAEGFALPVSPAAALFPRLAVERWLARVEAVSRATPLREYFMWRRAIGPDLLLYFVALGDDKAGAVSCSKAEVAQFSAHEGSITISSSPWFLTMGYWLARCAALTDPAMAFDLPDARADLSEAILQGYVLRFRAPAQLPGFGPAADVRHAITQEIDGLRRLAVGAGIGHAALALPAARAIARRVGRKLVGTGAGR
ncbi:glycosyltransferase family 2 protein [Croceicoccus sp. BE223]|uniref:glycosyltransferase family 2 protein n=1 Tax=Croceicoccus sp. BE223 TaxID=2817716 RepID=UPI002862209E|nr:glycosyltransferase family 2 protein [Croceicoccus sp. BE223]MDR7102056.1 hypothetical protein [Croceicoccus sp. BE223]